MTKFYGGCGVDECVDCLPLYDENNEPIPGTDDPVVATAYAAGMRRNSILTETANGVYYTGPLEPAQRAMRDEYGGSLTVKHRDDGRWIVTEHRGGSHSNPNQWGAGATEEEAWRYLIGADFGPLDPTYDDEGYEAHQRKMLGLDAPTT